MRNTLRLTLIIHWSYTKVQEIRDYKACFKNSNLYDYGYSICDDTLWNQIILSMTLDCL